MNDDEQWVDEDGEQSGSLDSAAVALHEVFMAFARAGFSEEQAFRLVLEQWKATITLP